MKQFEIWWAQLPEPAGRRPVLLLSHNDAYSYLNKFLAAEITTVIRGIPVEVKLGSREGLPKPSVVNCDCVRTVSKKVLTSRISQLAPARVREVWKALGYALGCDPLIDL